MTIERFPVEATHVLMFARAIGDPNPAYSDPDSAEARAAGGVVLGIMDGLGSADF